jgi:centractin
MLFSVIVRLHSAMMNWLELNIIHLDLSVGRPKHVRVMAGALEGDVFIGRRAQEFRGLLKIKYPMEHGIVTDWDDMERIWSWIYAEELGTLSEEV